MWQIPVDSSAYQTQSFRVGAESLRLILRWNPVPCCWSMDLYTATLDQPVAQGVPWWWASPAVAASCGLLLLADR